jgi:DNA-directed RNA polymerase specialized sigma24 family protein
MATTGLGHAEFAKSLKLAAVDVAAVESSLSSKRATLKRVARAAHAAGMTERQIAEACGRSGPAVHAWLHEATVAGE